MLTEIYFFGQLICKYIHHVLVLHFVMINFERMEDMVLVPQRSGLPHHYQKVEKQVCLYVKIPWNM